MPEALAPAYYTALGRGWRRDVWAVLHPPYTAWHLSYVVIGASLAPRLSVFRLTATLVAFFLAVGIAAHSLDELNGRPLRTAIPTWVLKTAGWSASRARSPWAWPASLSSAGACFFSSLSG